MEAYKIIHFETEKGKFIAAEITSDQVRLKSESGNNIRVYIDHGYQMVLDGGNDVSLIGVTKELTSEQWIEIVDKIAEPVTRIGYKNYAKSEPYWFWTATESGQSLMASIGLPIVNSLGEASEKEIKNYLILKVK